MKPAGHAPTRPLAAVRAFVAVMPGDAALNAVAQLQGELARRVASGVVRWTRPGQFHLTLRFLGNIAPSQVELLTRRLTEALAGMDGCELELGAVGAFPSPAAPRVLWVGLGGEVAGLQRLEQRVAAACTGIGDPQAGRDRFHPHLTLGRAGQHGQAGRVLAELVSTAPRLPRAPWRVGEVCLYRSLLTREGAVHSVLARFPLGTALPGTAGQAPSGTVCSQGDETGAAPASR